MTFAYLYRIASLAIVVIGLVSTELGMQSSSTFEVAAVKPDDPDARVHSVDCHDPSSPISAAGRGRCSVRSASLKMMILYAYGLEERAYGVEEPIRGGPAWMATEAYGIEAKAEDPTTSTADLKRMLQNLLADRFKLQLHFVTQEFTGYALVIGNDAGKLQPGDSTASRGAVSSRVPPTAFFKGKNTGLDTLARALSRMLSAPVENRTGLSGNYAINLSWAANDESPEPSLPTVLQDQLGLKLESMKVPVKLIVIDHAEKPTGN